MSTTTEVVHGTTTVWLALASVWPLPPGCDVPVFLNDSAMAIYYPYDSHLLDPSLHLDRPQCLPPEVTRSWIAAQATATDRPTTLLGGNGTSFQCPAAYMTVGTSVSDSSTFIACCPSGYLTKSSVNPSIHPPDCTSYAPAGLQTILSFPPARSGSPPAPSSSITLTVAAGSVFGLQVVGYNVAPRTTASVTSPALVAASKTDTATNPPYTVFIPSRANDTADGNPRPDDSSGQGLPTSSKIALGVALPLGILILFALFLLALFYRRRKRRRDATIPHPPLPPPTTTTPSPQPPPPPLPPTLSFPPHPPSSTTTETADFDISRPTTTYLSSMSPVSGFTPGFPPGLHSPRMSPGPGWLERERDFEVELGLWPAPPEVVGVGVEAGMGKGKG